MKIKKIITLFSVLIVIVYLTHLAYKKFFIPEKKELYKTEFPQKRNIYQVIYATGKLEIKDNIKIGSLVAGTIKKIFVKENEKVKKGQLLATIDNGKEDTQVRKKEGELKKAKLELEYQNKYYNRQKQLFSQNQISKDFFEQIKRDLEKFKADVKIKKAELEVEQIEFKNTRALAPDDGIIISVGITKGMKITTDLDATVLFEIAKDVTKMEAKLDIDESDIGQIIKGQKVKFTVGTYLDKVFKGLITDVSYSPQFKNGILSYKATVHIDNKDQMLRPGMTINAKINVAKCIDCLAITSQAFQINSKILKKIAKKLKFNFIPIQKNRKKELQKNNKGHYSIKYVWVVQGQSFVEKAIKVNITDDNYFEIKTGMTGNDKVIVDVIEEDEMESLYRKMFKGAL